MLFLSVLLQAAVDSSLVGLMPLNCCAVCYSAGLLLLWFVDVMVCCCDGLLFCRFRCVNTCVEQSIGEGVGCDTYSDIKQEH